MIFYECKDVLSAPRIECDYCKEYITDGNAVAVHFPVDYETFQVHNRCYRDFEQSMTTGHLHSTQIGVGLVQLLHNTGIDFEKASQSASRLEAL